jgi:hypothetical protein
MAVRRLALALLTLAALAPVPAAHATLYPGDTLDGPSPDIVSLGDVDVARDARGAVVYLKNDGGAAHVFAARFREGGFAAPERLDPGFVTPSAQPVVATSNDGRIAVAFVHDGALWGVVRASGDAAWSPPTLLYADPAPLVNPVTNPSIDMSINGVAYVVFQSAGNVYASRLVDTTWTPIPSALDIDPAQTAGLGAGRPRVAVSADNNAVAAWGEHGADGREHVYARRLTELVPSAAPQDLTLPDLDGHAGGNADSPDIDIEDDSSFAWAVFRQDFADGGATRSRTIARRLVGSLFDPPVPVDGLAFPASTGADAPRIDMTGRGEALVASGHTGPFEVWGDVLSFDKFAPGVRIDATAGTAPPHPVVATGENRYGVIAWQRDAGGGSREIVARPFLDDPKDHFEDEQVVSRPEYGPVDASRGLEVAADRAGNSVIAFIQGGAADSRVVVAELDRVPGRPQGLSTTKFQRFSRPTLRWRPSTDVWGPITYTVLVDGAPVGTSTGSSLVPAAPIADGPHKWTLTATDRRGQQAVSRTRLLRVDATAPTIELSVSGKRKKGKGLRFRILVSDGRSRTVASGTKSVLVSFGDRTGLSSLRNVVHRYKHRGSYTVRVSARDRVGNVAVLTKRLKIKK